MPTSTTLQLKISATKKRLSNGFGREQTHSVLGISFLFVAISGLIRIISPAATYGVVALRIPVVSSPLYDKTLAGFKETPKHSLEKTSIAVALTPSALVFGDLAAFTSNSSDVSNKFSIDHVLGSPQVETLLEQIESWKVEREKKLSIRSDATLVLIPDSRVPMNIVIQVTHLLNQSKSFQEVILAGGLM